MSAHVLAAAIDRFGGVDELTLRRLPRRAPGRGNIEVQVEAASINAIDVRRRGGYGRKLFSLLGAARMPLVLGNDFAGIVTAVGRGVPGLREGDAVFGTMPASSAGSHASHVLVRAEHAALQPAGMAAPALAVLPYNFLTVSRALADAGLDGNDVRGCEVLVHGASGGLGLLAVRLLSSRGAQVTAVCGGAHTEACRQAGAAFVIDRHQRSLRDLPRRFAATLNFANWDDEAALLRLLAPDALGHATVVHPMLGNVDRLGLLRGVIATMRQKRRMRALAPYGARYAWTVFAPDSKALADLARNAASYVTLQARVEFRLADAAQAHLHVEQRLPGRAVLRPGQE